MKSFLKISSLLLCLCLLAGCTTWQRVILHDDLMRANKHYKNGRFGQALVNYQQIFSFYPEVGKKQEIMMRIADCYYRLRQNPASTDAYHAYEDYLREFPNGLFREDAEDGMKKVLAIHANRNLQGQQRHAQNERNVEELRAALEQNQYDAQLWAALGDAEWKVENYDEAAKAYAEAIEIDATLREFKMIQARVEYGPDGWQAISPNEQDRRARERNPFVVTISKEYISSPRANFLTGAQNYYIVTGFIYNQSSRYIDNAVLEMYFLDATKEMVDLQIDAVGSLPPGAVRGFMVKGANIDNVFNVGDIEYQVYER